MFRHYFVTAVRNLLRYKLFTSINVVGLSISMAIFLALTGYVSYHFSYDKFFKDGDRIFRIDYYEYQADQPVLQTARTHDRTAVIAGEYVPQIEAITRVYNEKMGLLGMATLSIVKRTKEIAVRKTLGASVPNILIMLSMNYVRLVMISAVFAVPLA